MSEDLKDIILKVSYSSTCSLFNLMAFVYSSLIVTNRHVWGPLVMQRRLKLTHSSLISTGTPYTIDKLRLNISQRCLKSRSSRSSNYCWIHKSKQSQDRRRRVVTLALATVLWRRMLRKKWPRNRLNSSDSTSINSITSDWSSESFHNYKIIKFRQVIH